MNDTTEDYDAEEALINRKPSLSIVWFLPLIALMVSGWLIYKSFSEKGPVITINFPNAEGLEVDKTKIKYLDVEVGTVTEIHISEDSKSIIVTAQMDSDAEAYLKQQTSFWVVRPQVGLRGVSGLNTLLSGPYIGMKPGFGNHQTRFIGLTSPPLLKNNAEGKHFILETSSLNSLLPGTPINFHGIMAGEVLSHELSKEADAIKLNIFINKPYDSFVRKNTRFWADSGIDLSAGADGFQVRTGPLVSLLSGGIAFRTASEDAPEDVADENTVFHLYENHDKSTEVTYKNSLKYVMYFTSSVRGLTLGAPVQLRGIPVGRVTDISLELDKKTAEIRVPVVVELELDRMRLVNDLPTVSNKDMMQNLINKGLSAQLQTGSLLTGQLLVDLDFYPKAKTVHPDAKDVASVYPVFPTIASSIDQITHSAQMIMDKIAKLPLDQMSSEVTQTLQSVRLTAGHVDTTLSAATATLAETEKTMSSAKQVLQSLEPGSTTHYELDKLLQELNQTANSVKRLTDYLQQHPDTLLRGKPNE